MKAAVEEEVDALFDDDKPKQTGYKSKPMADVVEEVQEDLSAEDESPLADGTLLRTYRIHYTPRLRRPRT